MSSDTIFIVLTLDKWKNINQHQNGNKNALPSKNEQSHVKDRVKKTTKTINTFSH